MGESATTGGLTSAGIEVAPPVAGGRRLAGPGTGRAVSSPGDARAERVRSFDVADFPLPSGREEEWRFTPLDRLAGLLDGPPTDGAVEADWTGPVPLERVAREDPRVGSALVPEDRLAALALERTEKPAVLSFPPNFEGETPYVLSLRGRGGVAYDHTVLEIGQFAQVVLVLDHTGSAAYVENTEILVGDGASLTLVSLQDWRHDAVHAGTSFARLGRDARFKSVVVSFGGDLARLATTVRFAGPGGDAELLGLYFADAGQHLEHRLLVDHAAPSCRSRVTYKGALQGDGAHTVWVGDVVIRADAVGTDTYELNRNLLLTDGARADSIPNLEIETGEVVGAGHASATGRFDDEQLFYLQARGIPTDIARRLVVRGFFADVIRSIGIPDIAERLTAAVDAELERVRT
jgi:Fe-S cluster assembly protein SufD